MKTYPLVRSVIREEAPVICQLAEQLGYPNKPAEISDRLSAILTDPEQTVLTVDVEDRKTAGYIHLVAEMSLETGYHVQIASLVVDADLRGTGLGKILIAAAEDWAREKGCHQIRLRSNVIRERAHEFYKNLGYSITKSQHSFVKLLD